LGDLKFISQIIINYLVLFVFIRIICYELFILSNKPADRAIVGSFSLRGEEAAWKLFHPPVISDALTTFSLSVARFIGTGASGFVLF
jgi:hypothetical protein